MFVVVAKETNNVVIQGLERFGLEETCAIRIQTEASIKDKIDMIAPVFASDEMVLLHDDLSYMTVDELNAHKLVVSTKLLPITTAQRKQAISWLANDNYDTVTVAQEFGINCDELAAAIRSFEEPK